MVPEWFWFHFSSGSRSDLVFFFFFCPLCLPGEKEALFAGVTVWYGLCTDYVQATYGLGSGLVWAKRGKKNLVLWLPVTNGMSTVYLRMQTTSQFPPRR